MSKAQAPRGPFRFDDAEVDDVDRFVFTAAATLHNAPITTSSTSTESKKSRHDESSSSKPKGKDMSKDNGPAVPLPTTDDGLLKVAAAGDGLVVVTPTGAMFVENTMRTAEDRVQGSPLVPCCLPAGVSLHVKSDGAFSLSEVPPDQSSAAPAKTKSNDKDSTDDGVTVKDVSSKTADEDNAAKKEGDADKKDEDAAVPADNNAHQFLQMPDGTHCAVMKVLSTRVVEAAGLGVVHKWGNVVPKIRKFSVSVLFSAALNGPASSVVKDGDVFVIVPVSPLQKFLKPFAPIDEKPQLALVFALKDEASWWLFAPTKPLPLDTPPDEFIRGHWMWPHTPTEPTKRVGSSMMLFRKDQGLAEKIQLHGAFARVEVKAVKQLGTRVFVLDNPDEVDVLYAKFLKREELRIAALKHTADDEDDEGPKGAPAKKTTGAKTGTKITAAAKANDKKAAPAKGKAAPKKKDTKVKAKTQRGKGKRDRDSDSDDDIEDSSDEFDDDSDETDETVTSSSDEDDLPMSQRFSLNITGSPVPTKKKTTPAAAATVKKMSTAPAASKTTTAAVKKTTARAGAVVATASAPVQVVGGNDVGVASERAMAGSFGCPPHAVQTFLVSDSAPCARNWDCPGSFPAAALRKLTRASSGASGGGKKATAAGTNAADSSFFLLEMVSASSSSSWTATAVSGKKGGGNNKGSKGSGASSSSVQFAVFAPAFAQPSESQPGGVSFWFVATGDRVSADQMRSQEAQPLPLQDVTKTTMSLRDAPPMLRVELETLQGAINTTAAAVKLDSVEDGSAFIGSELVTIAPGQFTAPRRSGGTGGGAGGSAISSLSQQNSKSSKSANGGLIQDSATVMGGIQIGAVISSTEMTETICTGPDQFATILKRAAPTSINTTQSAARPAAAATMITPDEMTSSSVLSEEILVASQTTEAAPPPPAPAAKKGRGRPPKARKLEVESSDDDLLAGKDSDEVSDDGDDDEDDVGFDEGGEDEDSDSDGLVDFDDDETSSGESEDSDEFPEMRRGKGRGRGGRAAATKSKASKQAGKSKSSSKKTAASKTAAAASASLGSTPAGKKDKKSAAPKPAAKQKGRGFALVRKTDLGNDEKDSAPSSQPPAASSRPAPATVAANKTPTPPTAAAVPQPPAAVAPAAAAAAEGDDEGALFAELLTSINAARMQE